jgi:hypothetical protein
MTRQIILAAALLGTSIINPALAGDSVLEDILGCKLEVKITCTQEK